MCEPRANKVLVIGWDAADWKVAAPLMDAGLMPNLERFVREGVMGNLATLYPVLSPMLWTSIATGKRAHKHGIHGFAEPDPDTGGVRPVTNLGRTCKAVWNILNQHGMRSNVVGWWPSHPTEPIDGVMVSNHYQKAVAALDKPWPMRPGTVHPARLGEQLAKFRVHPAEFGPELILPFVQRAAEVDQKKDKRLAGIAKILAETAGVHAAATAIMQHEPWDFMGVYYDGIDHFCHGYMRYRAPRPEWVSKADFELYKDVVDAAYRFHDVMLGTMMHLAGEDATIIIVSDHGFHPDHLRPKETGNEPAGPADEHRPFGVFAMRGPGVKRDQLVFGASLLDVTPTVLTLFGLPLGRDMDGRPLLTAFEDPPEVEYVDSWEDIAGADGRHPPDTRVDPVDEQQALEQLVELGYIDKPDEDRQRAAAATVMELRYNLARDYMDSGHLPEAIDLFRTLWDENPNESRFGVKRLQCELAAGRNAEAREALNRLVREKRRYASEARAELERLTKASKDRKPEEISKEDVKRRTKLRRRASVNAEAFAFLEGLLLQGEGEHEQALECFARAESAQVHNRPNVYEQMGNSLMALKRWADAEAQFRRMLEIDPVNPAARLGLARCHLGLRRPRQALEEASAAIGLVFRNARAHYVCGLALRRLRRYDEAVQAFETAIAQSPNYADPHVQLANLYQRRGELDKAGEHQRLSAEARERVSEHRASRRRARREPMIDLAQSASIGDLMVDDASSPLPDGAVVIVSGLPRSGTSMMMQMLRAGGLPLLTDEVRAADESNPRGYYELESAKALGKRDDWFDEAAGKGVKLVAQLLPKLPLGRDYRVIFMERPLGEVIASQRAMLERLGRDGASLSEHQLADTFRKQVDNVRRTLSSHPERVSVLAVDYHLALADPASTAARVNALLGGQLDEAAMAAAVAPELRNQRLA